MKMTIKQRYKITLRGYRILGKYCPGLIGFKIIGSIIESISPFINIWVSAQIINVIANDKSINKLFMYVLLAVITNFIFAIIKNVVDRISGVKEASMWDCFSKIFCDKQMWVDFVDLENAEYQHLKQKAEENLFMFGNGLAQLVWDTPGMINVIVSILASTALSISLFLADSSIKWLNSPAWILVVFLLIVIEGYILDKSKKKEQVIFSKWSDGSVWFNRAFDFYGQNLDLDLQRAKNVRIYRQDKIAENEINKMIIHNMREDGLITKMSYYQGISSFSAGVINALCYLFVVLKTYFGAFPIGNMVQYVGTLVKMTENFGNLTGALAENKIYCQHLQKLYEFLDMSGQDVAEHKTKLFDSMNNPMKKELHIEFRNVSFKYPGSDIYVLKNVSAKFDEGNKYAIVGQNGSGKTTFVKLLCRLYEPTEGEILLNGYNINEFDFKEYLRYLAVVFQDFQLFSFGIGQNVAASIDYDPEKVELSIRKAGISDRVKNMPEGLETCLYRDFSENGVEISGGEAQKIALARAIYKNAPLMILDEPTSALDPIAEAEVYSSFDNIANSLITIYISHRLSSCKFCDVVTVFDKGMIVQRGAHNDLLIDVEGKYYELWNAQAKYYHTKHKKSLRKESKMVQTKKQI